MSWEIYRLCKIIIKSTWKLGESVGKWSLCEQLNGTMEESLTELQGGVCFFITNLKL